MPSLLELINQAMDKSLAYSPRLQQQLQQIDGQSLKWIASDLGITLVFRVEKGRLQVTDQNQPTQVTLTASVKELVSLFKQRGSSEVEGLNIEGNPLVLKRFASLLNEVDFNWQQLTAELLGDFPAQMIVRIGTEVIEDSRWKLQRLKQDWQAYKRDERMK